MPNPAVFRERTGDYSTNGRILTRIFRENACKTLRYFQILSCPGVTTYAFSRLAYMRYLGPAKPNLMKTFPNRTQGAIPLLPLLLNTVLTLSLCTAAAKSSAQCVAPEMSLHSPVLIAGTDHQIGAVYLFKEVMTGVDAEIKINDLVGGAVLNNIDDSTGPGYYDAFQPFVDAPANTTSYLEWAITFKKAGTSIDTVLPCFSITGVDVDGNGVDLQEFIEAATPGSYALDPFTTLAFSFDGVRSKAVSDINVFPSIDTANRTAMFQMNFTNISTLLYRNGAISNHGSVMTRQTCIYFKSFFNNYTLLLPVRLQGFSAKASASGNQVSWSASNESGVARYELQKSVDGNSWQFLQAVQPGPSATNWYFVTDKEATASVYYRICTIAQNGTRQYSKSIRLQSAGTAGNSFVHSSFIGSGLAVQFSATKADRYEFCLWTMGGQCVSRQQVTSGTGMNSILVDPGTTLSNGMYLLTVRNGSGELIHQAKLFRNQF